MKFEWDKYNIEHIAVHNVEPFEAEEVFDDIHRCTFSAHSGRRGVLGATEEGRVLVVIFEIKEGRRIRVCTARNASNLEKKSYKRRRKGY